MITPQEKTQLWEMSGLLIGILIALGWLSVVIYREYAARNRPSQCPDCGAWYYRARDQRTCGGRTCGRIR